MTSFLSFHAVAAARGDGLRAELLALRLDVGAPYCERMPRRDGMTQSGPDPVPDCGQARDFGGRGQFVSRFGTDCKSFRKECLKLHD
jgi:hypothetical protein